MAKFRITVDRKKCIGCGACAAQCPDNFELETGEEYKAKVKHAEVTELGCNKDAESICPVQAIKIEEL